MLPALSRALLALLPSNEIAGLAPWIVPVTSTVRSSAGGAAKPLLSVPEQVTTGAPPGGSGAQAARAAVAPTEIDPQASAVADRSRARGLMIGMATNLPRLTESCGAGRCGKRLSERRGRLKRECGTRATIVRAARIPVGFAVARQ